MKEKIVSNGLTFACLTIIATGSYGRLRTLTILVNGVQSNKLRPRPLQKLNPKDLLQKNPLLKGNLCMVPSCNERQLGQCMKQVIENKI